MDTPPTGLEQIRPTAGRHRVHIATARDLAAEAFRAVEPYDTTAPEPRTEAGHGPADRTEHAAESRDAAGPGPRTGRHRRPEPVEPPAGPTPVPRPRTRPAEEESRTGTDPGPVHIEAVVPVPHPRRPTLG